MVVEGLEVREICGQGNEVLSKVSIHGKSRARMTFHCFPELVLRAES